MPFSPHLIDYTIPFVYICPRCKKDLRQSKSHTSLKEVLHLQKTLDLLLMPPYHIHTYPQWNTHTIEEFFLFLRDIIVLSTIISRRANLYTKWQIFLFSKPHFNKLSSKSGLPFDMRSIEERASLLYIASHLLKHDTKYLLNSLQYVGLTQAILNERTFPKSALMFDILFDLPPQTIMRHRHTNMKKKTISKEPRTAKEVEQEMSDIRKFL
jgi:hypothetical protein